MNNTTSLLDTIFEPTANYTTLWENATTTTEPLGTPGYPMNPKSWNKIYTYAIYFIEGSTMVIGNMLLVFAIWFHKALRQNKGYFVFAFMFLSDALNGLAQVFAAVYRTGLLFAGTHDILVTRWDCMLKLHTYVWAFAEPNAAMMLGVVSLDRLMLIMDPGSYISSMKLTYITIATPIVWNSVGLCVAFITAYQSPRIPTVAQYCLLSFGLGKKYWAYHGFLSVFGSGFSIMIYVVVVILYRKRNKARVGAGEGDQKTQSNKATLKAQDKLTRSLGWSCVVTFFVFLIPRLIGTSLDYSAKVLGIERGTVSMLMMIFYWIIGNFNAVINLFIFLRVDTIRTGVVAFLQCKSMPQDLNLWNNDASRKTAANKTAVTKTAGEPTKPANEEQIPVEEI